MALSDDLLFAFEVHSPEKIRAALAAGADPNAPIGGKAPILILVEMYLRSARFADCLKVLLEAGASLHDPLLECLLLDDSERLERLLQESPEDLQRRFSLACTYTSLQDATALHICAEYNSVRCARVLLQRGHGCEREGGNGLRWDRRPDCAVPLREQQPEPWPANDGIAGRGRG